MRELMGAVVVVVGATGGLGAAVTDELRRRGATVLGAGRGGPDIVCDLRDGGAGDAVVRGALGTEGRLDGVVNAAGVVAFGALADTDPVVVEELFLTNTMGPMWLARSVVPALAETRGFFAAITGVVAEQPVAGMVAYGASKAALSSALAGLRREVRRLGVQVIDVRPPHTETGLAGRPLAGVAPRLATGLDPAAVARRLVQAIVDDEQDVPAAAFA
ncbi:MAG: SDR family NAD(P)-dependent oxidoreductase [Acidimicrobiales bacterium]|nr:SDR family NAD(P)-dependent oxidoreductase [Acidimicrobiales bacterium]